MRAGRHQTTQLGNPRDIYCIPRRYCIPLVAGGEINGVKTSFFLPTKNRQKGGKTEGNGSGGPIFFQKRL